LSEGGETRRNDDAHYPYRSFCKDCFFHNAFSAFEVSAKLQHPGFGFITCNALFSASAFTLPGEEKQAFSEHDPAAMITLDEVGGIALDTWSDSFTPRLHTPTV
jgi:hypothetical protein